MFKFIVSALDDAGERFFREFENAYDAQEAFAQFHLEDRAPTLKGPVPSKP